MVTASRSRQYAPVLAGDGAIAGTGPFAAHFRVLQGETDTFVNFGVKAKGQDAQVSFYEFDAAGKLLRKQGLELPGAGFAFFHDFMVTENYYILYQNPVKLDTTKLVRRLSGLEACKLGWMRAHLLTHAPCMLRPPAGDAIHVCQVLHRRVLGV